MLKKVAVIGSIVAVTGLGVGGAAWASADSAGPQAGAAISAPAAGSTALSTSTVAAPTSPTKAATGAKDKKAAKGAKGKHHAGLARRLEKVSHAQWVSKDGKIGTFVTHDAVRGEVTAVGPTSITVKATDGTPESYAVTGTTKVRVRGSVATAGAAKPSGTIAQVKVGDEVGVLGTGADAKTATVILDRGVPHVKKAHVKKATGGKHTSTAPTTTS